MEQRKLIHFLLEFTKGSFKSRGQRCNFASLFYNAKAALCGVGNWRGVARLEFDHFRVASSPLYDLKHRKVESCKTKRHHRKNYFTKAIRACYLEAM